MHYFYLRNQLLSNADCHTISLQPQHKSLFKENLFIFIVSTIMLLPLPNDNTALFLQIAEGDKTAFRVIFDVYKAPFYSAAFKMTRSAYLAEEIVQEVFILLWTKRVQVAAAEKPAAYLLTILYNCIYGHFKKIAAEKNMKQLLLQNSNGLEEQSLESILQAKENQQLLNEIIEQLPPQQQLVYKLSKQEGMSRIDIAGQLHISPNSVRNHLHDAVKSIRHYFKDKKAISSVIICFLPGLF
jgi:RNA polymerase sigma-70 factor (family 1)